MHRTQEHIVRGVSQQVEWWLTERRKKLEKLSHETMSVNPFIIPLLMAFHGFEDFEELAAFLLGGHLAIGHNTGFGKLIDEKILPRVFGTTKLNRKFRASNTPLDRPMFDEIDHIVDSGDNTKTLLSLKAGRWTIQLTMAVQLNSAFEEMVQLKLDGEIEFDEIVLGAFYGKQEELTDKFDIARGINRGANHDVTDLTSFVSVLCGRELWAWINGGPLATQDWVMDGIIAGYHKFQSDHGSAKALIERYKRQFVRQFESHVSESPKTVNWHGILTDING